MHKTTLTVTLAIVGLIGAYSTALAGGSVPGVTLVPSRPGQPKLVSLSAGHRAPMVPRDVAADAGLTEIANNLTKYPNSPYYGWYGYASFGPQAGDGTEEWLATAFTPKANHLATRVEVAAEYDTGGDDFFISLNEDAGGVPGKALRSWQFTNLPHSPCCTLAVGSDKRGIPVTGGKRYWIVLGTTAKEPAAEAIWALTEYANVQKHGSSFAVYCSGGGCTNVGYKDNAWNVIPQILYGLAFSVLGK